MKRRTVQLVSIREIEVYADTDQEAIDAVIEMVNSGDACVDIEGDNTYTVTAVNEDE